ncbi:hypothetical protein D3C85_1130630 [compost metagenome]
MIRAVAKYDREFFQPSWKGTWRELLNAAPTYNPPKTNADGRSDNQPAMNQSTPYPYGSTVKLSYATDESCIGWAHRGESGELLSAYGRLPLNPDAWCVFEELPTPESTIQPAEV